MNGSIFFTKGGSMRTIYNAVMVAVALAGSGNALADDNGGSNAQGGEKVCAVGMAGQTEPGLVEALKTCRRGDILDIGWVQTAVAIQLCDFTKTVMYNSTKGAIIACVYTGTRRPVSKAQ